MKKTRAIQKIAALVLAFTVLFSSAGVNGFSEMSSSNNENSNIVKAEETTPQNKPVRLTVDSSKATTEFLRTSQVLTDDAVKAQLGKGLIVKSFTSEANDQGTTISFANCSVKAISASDGEELTLSQLFWTTGKKVITVSYAVPTNTTEDSTSEGDAPKGIQDTPEIISANYVITVVPEQVTDIVRTANTVDSLTLSWNAVVKSQVTEGLQKKITYVDEYNVYRFNQQTKKYDFIGTVASNQNNTSATTGKVTTVVKKSGDLNMEITAGTKYTLRITAVGKVEEYPISEGSMEVDKTGTKTVNKYESQQNQAKDFLTASKPKIDIATVKFTVSNQNTSEITLNWEAMAGADGYLIQTYNYRKDASGNYKGWEDLSTVEAKDAKTYSYVNTGLNPGTTHRYRIQIYTLSKDNVSAERYSSIKTGTSPSATLVTGKNGDQRVKISWSKVKNADGYMIYMSTAGGAYTLLENRKIDTTGDCERTKIITGLVVGASYSFKVVPYSTFASVNDGANGGIFGSYTNDITNEAATELCYVAKIVTTNTNAKKYSSQKKLKKSAAYIKYKTIMNKLNYKKSYILPGLRSTNVAGFESTNMVTQGVVFAGSYMFVSAYDGNEEENSVLYVLNKKTKKYVTTIVLPTKSHVGGLAYDGKNIWISDSTKTDGTSWVSCIKYATAKAIAKSGAAYAEVAFTTSLQIVGKPSYMTYYNGSLWIGENSESYRKPLYGYVVGNKTGVPTLTKTHRIAMMNRVQGVCFDKDGTMLVSRSNNITSSYACYISQIRAYKPKWSSVSTKGNVKKGKVVKVTTMPPMTEGIIIKGTYTYLNFESASFGECIYPLDRVIAFKTTNFTVKPKKK